MVIQYPGRNLVLVTLQNQAVESDTVDEQVVMLQKLAQQHKVGLRHMMDIPLQVCPPRDAPHPPLQKIKAELVRINLDDMSRS